MDWFRVITKRQNYWDKFKPQNKVEVIVDEEGSSKTYHFYLERIDKNGLVLRSPLLGNHLPLLKTKTIATIRVYTEESIFSFDAVLIPDEEGGARRISISRPSCIRETQRRQSFRLNIIRPVQYKVLAGSSVVSSSALTKDISEGGMFLVAREPISPGKLIEAQISLNTNELIKATARVLRQERFTKDKFLIGLEFIDVNEQQKETMRKFIIDHTR